MANPFYNASGAPVTSSAGASSVIRAEFAAIAAGFNMLPSTLTANALVVVNGSGTGLTTTTSQLTLAGPFITTGAFSTTLAQGANVVLTLPLVNGTLATLAGTETLTNKTITSPVLSGTVTGTYTLGGTPTITSPTITGAAITTSTYNGLTITSSTGTLTIAAAKTLTASNTMTLQATDGAVVNFGAGGTVSYGGGSSITSLTGDVTGTGPGATATTVAKIAGTTVSGTSGTGNVLFSASPTITGTLTGPTTALTSTSASALAVGANGATNPVLAVDASTPSVATGLSIKGAASTGGLALSVISSGANENLKIDAKGSGTITLAGTSTGGITMTRSVTMAAALVYGGVTLTNAVTGTGKMVLDTSPTIQSTLTVAGSITASLNVDAGNDGTNAWLRLQHTSTTVAYIQAVTAASAAARLDVYSGGTIVGSFNTDASFTVGSQTGAGAGAIAATGNVISAYSDERLKENMAPITDAIAKVMTLKAFTYNPNKLAVERSGGKYNRFDREVGLSAQDVLRVLPEAIRQAPFDREFMTVLYERTVPLLVAALQEQQREISDLKARLAA